MDDLYASGTGTDGPEGHPDQKFCRCGEAWFEGGTLAFEKDGTINGAAGWWRCIGCGEPVPANEEV